jgi:penicillin amidase
VHKAEFAHPLLGSLPVIGRLASRSVPVPGDNATLFRGGNGVLGEFASLHGAAYRGVYDLADLERSRFVVAPGQSGNFFSPHAWDMLKLWAAGTTIAIPASPDIVSGEIHLAP